VTKRKEDQESKQRHYKVGGQEEARELRQEEAWKSHHILPGVLKNVREYEGVNPHTPKATPNLGDGVLVDS
jgi:isopentenyl diphosphate isomerase/L-lactate dehydrogenase-like FMN-dependent dehydrogenase